jgi:hypothetical protein|tara:strand:+ start:277 stop:483 length:207 start_codon:yes stop_codon:yes gene_type:complete
MPNYEAAIYNQEVRDAIASGKQHERVSHDWADVRFIEVTAPNQDMALAKINEEYPSGEGFVVEEIMEA